MFKSGTALLIAIALASTVHAESGQAPTQAPIDAKKPDQPTPWYPSRYGSDDMIGAANNLSADIVAKAAARIREGKVYELGIDIGAPESKGKQPFPGMSYEVTVIPVKEGNMIGHDDLLHMWMGTFGSSMDGLGHIGIGDRYYNGHKAEDVYAVDGLKKLATNNVPPIVTRGVMLDFAAYYGVDKLPESTALNRKEIDAVAAKQKVTIQKGDVVLFHTGWLPTIAADGSLFMKQPGLGVDGARYLAGKGVVAIGADNQGLEVLPPENPDPDYFFPVHRTLLAENGVYILEDINTAELARDKAYEFLFVLGAPKLAGAVQVPVNPIAIR